MYYLISCLALATSLLEGCSPDNEDGAMVFPFHNPDDFSVIRKRIRDYMSSNIFSGSEEEGDRDFVAASKILKPLSSKTAIVQLLLEAKARSSKELDRIDRVKSLHHSPETLHLETFAAETIRLTSALHLIARNNKRALEHATLLLSYNAIDSPNLKRTYFGWIHRANSICKSASPHLENEACMKKALIMLQGSLLVEAQRDKEPKVVHALKIRDEIFQQHSSSGKNIDTLFSAFEAIWESSPPLKEAREDGEM